MFAADQAIICSEQDAAPPRHRHRDPPAAHAVEIEVRDDGDITGSPSNIARRVEHQTEHGTCGHLDRAPHDAAANDFEIAAPTNSGHRRLCALSCSARSKAHNPTGGPLAQGSPLWQRVR